MIPFSIIIPAYRAQNFIEECLDSIDNQTYFKNNNNYEILLGIDNCPETLDKIYPIRKIYDNLRIFMMDKNVGPYVVKNTLIPLITTPNVIFFDADDIMAPYMIAEIAKEAKNKKYIRLGYSTFHNNDLKTLGKNISNNGDGVFFCTTSLLDQVGGFMPWRCGADTELKGRLSKIYKPLNLNKKVMFYRRAHSNSLTQNPETGMGSALRKKYMAEINHKLRKIDPETVTYKEIL